MNIASLVGLLQTVDPETLLLLKRFVERAKQQSDTNGWLKRQLKTILDEEIVILEPKKRR
jgi:hypothetical protein